jgi:dTDP-4-dehydro-6-deoxy-alpha-D-glucopyranose 2,3-dehydratase
MKSFSDTVAAYQAAFKAAPSKSALRAEAHVESLRDWSPVHSLDEVRAWFENRRANPGMAIMDIPVADCREWQLDPATGFIRHGSGDFFYVQGLRVEAGAGRERGSGWDQPMLTQVGFDGGILGLLRQRMRGVPMYLVEAKAEPGNYRLIQMSPTVQATFANLRRSHGGRKPHFAEYFEAPSSHGATVHFDRWLSEDGGRLANKRNRGMLVEVPEDTIGDLPPNFLWMSLWQIKECLHEDAWVNPHVRGIIAHL